MRVTIEEAADDDRVEQDDAKVIDRSRSEPEAFEIVFRRYSGQIQRYVGRRLGADAADDIVAETFLLAFRQRGRYDLAHSCARPWLYGIATNLIGRHRRAETRQYRALAQAGVEVSPSPGWLRQARRRRARLIGGAVASAVMAAVAAVVVPAVAPSSPGHSFAGEAWAVEWHGDGTVTVALNQPSFKDPAGLQRALRADGIMAYVSWSAVKTRMVGGNYYSSVSCYCDPADDAALEVQKAVITWKPHAGWIIRPAAMPAGSALLIAGGSIPQLPGSLFVMAPVVLRRDRLPACLPLRVLGGGGGGGGGGCGAGADASESSP